MNAYSFLNISTNVLQDGRQPRGASSLRSSRFTDAAARAPLVRRPRGVAAEAESGSRQSVSQTAAAAADTSSGAIRDDFTLPDDFFLDSQPVNRSSYPTAIFHRVKTMPPASSLPQAQAALLEAVEAAGEAFSAYTAGLVRLEVPLPRSVGALRWLQGQQQTAAAAPSLCPKIFFSPRRSSAPDTEGSTAAGAARAGAGSVAGAGAAWQWKGEGGEAADEAVFAAMRRFLGGGNPRVRVYGGTRFDPASAPAPEWVEFGSYCFVLPRIELLETSGGALLSCTLAWDGNHAQSPTSDITRGFTSLEEAAADAISALYAAWPSAPPRAAASRLQPVVPLQHIPDDADWGARLDSVHSQLTPATSSSSGDASANPPAASAASLLKLNPNAALEEYLRSGQQGLDGLLEALDRGFEAVVLGSSDGDEGDAERGQLNAFGDANNGDEDTRVKKAGTALTKVVLARRSDLQLTGRLDPLTLLEALQERDPRAYQVLLQLPSGATFLASTPECLYTRSGAAVASEAVAGTRARGAGGDVEKDFWLSFDLLRSQKDDVEFGVVRDWVRRALGTVCEDVVVEVTKSVVKQGAVQHLYGKLAGTLRAGVGDAEMLRALHPTPAVCGQPRGEALRVLSEVEPFDRGWYSGPFGWISNDAAEFVVAIRSALVRSPENSASSNGVSKNSAAAAEPLRVSLYAGVGIVRGSDTASEWAELNLKISQFERLLKPAPSPRGAPNVAALWARLTVEELCRQGCNTFCVAPGSRSSPLTTAIAYHPRARIVSCIDERSLGFWALGFGRATGRPAVVVTSSGTAVANLLPAVVEASQSGVPMLLLTADRPPELRDTGANQTIDQVKIFGGYVRWEYDVQAPTEAVPARSVLTTVDAAVAATQSCNPGPVHLNCQYREPLAPLVEPWGAAACLRGLERWETSDAPFTTTAELRASSTLGKFEGEVNGPAAVVLTEILQAKRGLIVVGELVAPEDVSAAVQLAQNLGWPVAADILSGLRIGAPSADGTINDSRLPLALLPHFDHILLDPQHWPQLQPDVILQLGGRLTSKRTAQFLEASAAGFEGGEPSRWVFVDRTARRHDQAHRVTHRLQAAISDVSAIAGITAQVTNFPAPEQAAYAALLVAADAAAGAAVDAALGQFHELTEPAVARLISQELPLGDGLFAGNSMPIRDLDMYALPRRESVAAQGAVGSGVGAPVAANRGASGIDGVLSTAAGFADGLGRGCTLVVGDISFLHDINGLNLLRNGEMRPPLTVVLVNNAGGGIFSFLPIADHLPEDVFTPLWATPQHVDLAGMCRAHGIPHVRVASQEELRVALRSAWGLNRHSVIEAVTDRGSNVARHREVQAAAKAAVGEALVAGLHGASAPSSRMEALVKEEGSRSNGAAAASNGSIRDGEQQHEAAPPSRSFRKVVRASYELFSIPLRRALTTQNQPGDEGAAPCRQGIYIYLEAEQMEEKEEEKEPSESETPPEMCERAQFTVAGEISPLPGLHAESLEDAVQQAAFLCASLPGLTLPSSLNELEAWLGDVLGIDAAALLPSVRFGLESAVLSAVSRPCDGLFAPHFPSASVARINSLIDPRGDVNAAVEAVIKLKDDIVGCGCVKIKVGRVESSPAGDAAAVMAVRSMLGPDVVLRADANRGWGLEDAVAFGKAVYTAGLQYIEEPVADPADLAVFYQQTGIPTALDESVDEGLFGVNAEADKNEAGDAAATPMELPAGVTALVLKPAVLGGLLCTLRVAKLAAAAGVSSVISSAFESPLGLVHLAQLAMAVDPPAESFHGLGTADWFDSPTVSAWWEKERLGNGDQLFKSNRIEESMPAKGPMLGKDALRESWMHGHGVVPLLRNLQSHSGRAGDIQTARKSVLQVAMPHALYDLHFIEADGCAPQAEATSALQPPVLFLHGFLGQAEEWLPFMQALSSSGRRCLALRLPGHGGTAVHPTDDASASATSIYSLEAAAAALEAALLARSDLQGGTLVGYSLGARLALLLASRRPELIGKVIAVSGTPGMEEESEKHATQRAQRAMADSNLAGALRRDGVGAFVERWYGAPMWATLRARPGLLERLKAKRAETLAGNEGPLSATLEEMSPGRAPNAWKRLENLAAGEGRLSEVVLVAGDADAKFVRIARKAEKRIKGARAVVMPDCGHAVHVERPLALLKLLQDLVLG